MAKATLIIKDDAGGVKVKIKFDPELDLENESNLTTAQKLMLMAVAEMNKVADSCGGSVSGMKVS